MVRSSVRIPLDDFARFLATYGGKSGYKIGHEFIFSLPVSLPPQYTGSKVTIEVFSSITSEGLSRNTAQDAIRLLLMFEGKNLASQKRYRTKNWRRNLQDAIHILRTKISPDYLCRRGHPMIVRENRRKQPPTPFWSCVRFPECRGTRPFR